MIDIPDNHKFAVLGLPVVGLHQTIRIPLRADGTLWATSAPPVEIDQDWKSWLGLRSDRFGESNLFVTMLQPSEEALILDAESQKLSQHLRNLYIALGIIGLQFDATGLLVTGGKLAPNGLMIRAVEDTSRQFILKPNPPFELKEHHLVQSARIADNVWSLYATKPQPRLARGLRSLVVGLESRYGEDRLHCFVRSIDAVAKLPKGQARKLFIERCQTFAGRSPVVCSILEELYDLRSAAEHLNDYRGLLADYLEIDHDDIAKTRAVQAEVLARFVYAHILGSEHRTRDFMSDENLDLFWALPTHQLDSVWGESIDITRL